MSRTVLLTLLLVATTALAQDEAVERAAVREQLATQRTALALIESKKVSVLEGLELLEQISAFSRKRVQVVEKDLAVFRKRVAAAEKEEAVARMVLQQQLRRLTPRMRALYRLTRRQPLEVLLTSEDFSSLVWRARTLEATMKSDLELLRAVQQVARLEHQALLELRRLQGSLASRMAFLKEQVSFAQQQQAALKDVVATLTGEADLVKRTLRELEQADAELTRMLEDLKEGMTATGFRALKGKLPFPTPGVVEVGFGKVVNPLFNTVTVQKGVDIRAAEGAPVHAVAEGKVVFAGWMRGYGNLLILDHGSGYHSLMAHLSSVLLEVGAEVQVGEQIGTVGDTGSLKGAYLYFEIRKGGLAVDPAPWFARGS
ncbi:murein hydrolase activator EnvC family protein [Hyalangium versicolor]|uniref:murein hydrolase activator EnvC family protein n=1 Tax=Hyalangium versicolor TaxID=2861190 RepID=UPI001CCEA71E|nr:peptidoglycan DD-metalloendopeptidase family protein [Hyalangium versicolor]